jgi:hypothetical protein
MTSASEALEEFDELSLDLPSTHMKRSAPACGQRETRFPELAPSYDNRRCPSAPRSATVRIRLTRPRLRTNLAAAFSPRADGGIRLLQPTLHSSGSAGRRPERTLRIGKQMQQPTDRRLVS